MIGGKPQLLELFAGTRSIGKAFEKVGWQVYSVDTDEKLTDCHHADAYAFLKQPLIGFDAIWLSPMCTTYSKAGLRFHRTFDPETGRVTAPVSDYAKQCDALNAEMVADLNRIIRNTDKVVLMENPRGNLRVMPFMQDLQLERSTVTYSSYGDTRLKPTDIWHNIPMTFRPQDKQTGGLHTPNRTMNWDGTITYGSTARTHGMRERSVIPAELCDDIARQVDQYVRDRLAKGRYQ